MGEASANYPALPAAMERVRRRLAGVDDGNRQMVDILTAVVTDGLSRPPAPKLSPRTSTPLKTWAPIDSLAHGEAGGTGLGRSKKKITVHATVRPAPIADFG
jgi:hypothetical protein